MTTIDTTVYKKKLEDQKKLIEKELGTIAHHEEGDGWEAVNTLKDDSIDADANEVADKIEEYETNIAIVNSLNQDLREVDAALTRIDDGTYGICEVTGHEIETERLDANPSARTCKDHVDGI